MQLSKLLLYPRLKSNPRINSIQSKNAIPPVIAIEIEATGIYAGLPFIYFANFLVILRGVSLEPTFIVFVATE